MASTINSCHVEWLATWYSLATFCSLLAQHGLMPPCMQGQCNPATITYTNSWHSWVIVCIIIYNHHNYTQHYVCVILNAARFWCSVVHTNHMWSPSFPLAPWQTMRWCMCHYSVRSLYNFRCHFSYINCDNIKIKSTIVATINARSITWIWDRYISNTMLLMGIFLYWMSS